MLRGALVWQLSNADERSCWDEQYVMLVYLLAESSAALASPPGLNPSEQNMALGSL